MLKDFDAQVYRIIFALGLAFLSQVSSWASQSPFATEGNVMTTTDVTSLGPGPGTYALVLSSPCEAEISVGRLGVLAIRQGFYVYVGSAFGPGGVRGRVARHVIHGRTRHWHVDYLWPTLRVDEIWYSHDPRRREHDWARILRSSRSGSVPLRRFGASDCRCDAHLLFFEQAPSIGAFREQLHTRIRGHHSVRRVRSELRHELVQ